MQNYNFSFIYANIFKRKSLINKNIHIFLVLLTENIVVKLKIVNRIMESTVKQRVKSFLSYQEMSVNQLSKISGMGQMTLNDQINGKAKIGINTITFLLDYFNGLSAEWLLRGEGDMERRFVHEDRANIHIDTSGDHIQGDHNTTHSTVNENNDELIELRVENKMLKEQVQDLRNDKDNLIKLLTK